MTLADLSEIKKIEVYIEEKTSDLGTLDLHALINDIAESKGYSCENKILANQVSEMEKA
jgi:hypothetical protein